MCVVRIPKELGDRLAALAKATGRTRTYYMDRALRAFLPIFEDEERRIQKRKRKGRARQ